MYSAVILAGGESPWLKEVTGTPYRAWAPLKGKPMALYIADALLKSGKVDKVLILGSTAAIPCSLPEKVEAIEAGDTLMSTVRIALDYLGTERPVIFSTDDIPCLTADAVRDFVEQAEKLHAQVCYTVIPKSAVEKDFPTAKRTYVKIKDEKFTGGNVFLVEPLVIPKCCEQVEAVFAKRKDVFSLCKWLGWSFISFPWQRIPLQLLASTLCGPVAGRAVHLLSLSNGRSTTGKKYCLYRSGEISFGS